MLKVRNSRLISRSGDKERLIYSVKKKNVIADRSNYSKEVLPRNITEINILLSY